MNIQRDINPENDKKLDKMLDAKFCKQRRSLVKGDTIRTAQSMLKHVLKARKQFEDSSFNKPVGEKVSKHNAFAYKTKKKITKETQKPANHGTLPGRDKTTQVTKHGKHDQRTHSPTGRAAIAREQGKKKPKSKDKKPSSAGRAKLQGRTDPKGKKPGQVGYINPDWHGDGPEPMFMQRASAKVASWIDSKIPGREKRLRAALPKGAGSDKPASPDNLNGYVNASYGRRKLFASERRILSSSTGRKAFDRAKKKQRRKKMTKHGSHDQSSHSPTGRAAVATTKKPKSGASSKAPSKVRARSAVRGAVQGAKDTVQRTREAVSRNKENFRRVGREIDSVLDGLDSASRLYQELVEAKNLITDRLGSKKVTKGKVTHTEAYNRVKDKPGVKNPHALAQHIVEEAGGEKTKKALTIDEARERHARLRGDKVTKSIEKGISHSLEILTNAIRLIGEQEADKDISEEDDKKIGELVDEILGVAGYLDTVQEEGQFEKGGGDANVPDSTSTFRPSFTTPAVAEELRREGIEPNAKGRGTSTSREPGY